MEFVLLEAKISTYINAISQALNNETFEAKAGARLRLLLQGLTIIGSNADEYDMACPFTKGTIGGQFELLVTQQSLALTSVNQCLKYIGRFVREKTIATNGYIDAEVNILEYWSPLNPEFDQAERMEANYIGFLLPKNLFDASATEKLAKIDNILEAVTASDITIAGYAKSVVGIEGTINEWSDRVSGWEDQVNAHRDFLKNIKSTYSFAGLSHAFSQMLDTKTKERGRLRFYLLVFGTLILCPPLAHLLPKDSWISVLHVDATLSEWFKYLPVAAIELVLFYFFRIFLMDYYSTKDQILQLDYKLSMCAFVDSYVDFAKSKESNSIDARLTSFESAVFTPVRDRVKDIPTNADLLNALEPILKILRSTKPSPD